MAALARASAADTSAHALFDELFRRHVLEARSFAWRMVRDWAGAEEIVQEAFTRVWQLRERYRAEPEPFAGSDDDDRAAAAPGQRFLGWFFTIVRNLARDALRRRPHLPTPLPPEAFAQRPAPASGAGAQGGASGPAQAIAAEQRRRIELAVASLEPALQEAIVLRLYEDLTLEQVGQRLGLTPQGVRKRLLRAFEILRPKLADA